MRFRHFHSLRFPFGAKRRLGVLMFAGMAVLLLAFSLAEVWAGPSAAPPSGNPPSVPVGTVMPYFGSSVPQGWLLANGQAVSRSQYPALFAVLCPGGSCSFGNGDGSTTFNLPDFRDRFAVGASTAAGKPLGQKGGSFNPISHSHTFTGSLHSHTFSHLVPDITTGGGHQHGISSTPSDYGDRLIDSATTAGDHDHGGSTTGNDGSHGHTIPDSTSTTTTSVTAGGSVTTSGASQMVDPTNPYRVVNFIIKY